MSQTVVDANHVKQAVKSKNSVLLDVRRKDEVDQGKIASAVHIPLDLLESRIDELKSIAQGKKEIIVYCLSGARAARGYEYLMNQKIHERVLLYKGSWSDWTSKVEGEDGWID